MKTLASCAALLLFCAALARAQSDDSDPDVPTEPAVIQYIRQQIDANQARLDQQRGDRPKTPPWEGLPDRVSATLPEDEGFVAVPRVPDAMPLENLLDVSGLSQAGLKLSDVVEDEEWARLPDGASIRRDRSRGYEVWHYPPGLRLVHRLFLKPDHRLIELRLEEKLADGPDGSDGPWAIGIYRPVDDSGQVELYKWTPGAKESIRLPLPSALGTFGWGRVPLSNCRDCHIDMGEGWYQYSDEDHVGPCGFVPKNVALRADWARRYEAVHPGPVFTGP